MTNSPISMGHTNPLTVPREQLLERLRVIIADLEHDDVVDLDAIIHYLEQRALRRHA